MIRKFGPRKLLGRGARGIRRLRAAWSERSGNDLASRLAAEFGASVPVMAAFIDRFAPDRVARDRFRDSSDTVLFVHVPKTAGVSVGKALQMAFDRFHGVEWNNVPTAFRKAMRQAVYDQSRGNVRQVIMGHFGWPELQVWRQHDLQVKAGTILRDPVDRVISNFNYNSSDAHPARAEFVKRFPTIESFVRSTGYDVQLTQAIGFVASFDDVLAKLTAHYSFLGVTERLGPSLAHLSRTHGLPPITEFRANVGSKPADDLDPAVRTLILDRNHNDVKIHTLLLRLYDLPKVN